MRYSVVSQASRAMKSTITADICAQHSMVRQAPSDVWILISSFLSYWLVVSPESLRDVRQEFSGSRSKGHRAPWSAPPLIFLRSQRAWMRLRFGCLRHWSPSGLHELSIASHAGSCHAVFSGGQVRSPRNCTGSMWKRLLSWSIALWFHHAGDLERHIVVSGTFAVGSRRLVLSGLNVLG